MSLASSASWTLDFLSGLISHLLNSSILPYLGSFSCLIPSSNPLLFIVTFLYSLKYKHTHMLVQSPEENIRLHHFLPDFLEMGPSLNLGLAASARLTGWQTRGIFAAHVGTHTATPDFSFKSPGGTELRSSHWCSKNPYLLSYLPSHKTLSLSHSVSEAVATSLLLPCSGLSLCQRHSFTALHS